MKNILAFLVMILALMLWTPKASADEITLNLMASMIPGDGSVYQDPTLFVTGQISFDGATIFDFIDEHPIAFDLSFSWLGGGFEYIGTGTGHCIEFLPEISTCYFHSPVADSLSWGFQTNAFASLTPGTTFGACAARQTVYPDGGIGLGSGICGGTSGANILGHAGSVYGLRLDEGGGSSGTFQVVATDEPSTLPLLSAGFAVLLGLRLRRSLELNSQ